MAMVPISISYMQATSTQRRRIIHNTLYHDELTSDPDVSVIAEDDVDSRAGQRHHVLLEPSDQY